MEDAVVIDEVKCLRETEKAILCLIYGDEIWIPKSQIMEDSEVQGEEDEGFLHITSWFANREGLD